MKSLRILHCPTVHSTALQSPSQYCTLLYCIVNYILNARSSTALHFTALYCPPSLSTVLHCSLLQCTVLHYNALYCPALQCTVLPCTTMQCTALHSTALCQPARGAGRIEAHRQPPQQLQEGGHGSGHLAQQRRECQRRESVEDIIQHLAI